MIAAPEQVVEFAAFPSVVDSDTLASPDSKTAIRVQGSVQAKLLCKKELGGGGRGIRTPGTRKGTAVFKTARLNHSRIPPRKMQVTVPTELSLLRSGKFWTSGEQLGNIVGNI